jgi:hypothetical protein
MPQAKIILEPGDERAGGEPWAAETLLFRQGEEIIGRLARLLVDVVKICLKRHKPAPVRIGTFNIVNYIHCVKNVPKAVCFGAAKPGSPRHEGPRAERR